MTAAIRPWSQTVAGETEITTQLAVEQANMIREQAPQSARRSLRQAARTRGLWHNPGGDASVAGFKPDANYFGIFVHKDVPAPVKQTLDMIWKDVIAKSEVMKKYATTNGAQFAPVYGR